jgi:hypothetical protein
VGESTREPLVRLAEDGSVLLAVDRAVFHGEHDTLDPEDALVRVSPTRALELLEELSGLARQLRELAPTTPRPEVALGRAARLLANPLLATGWYSITPDWHPDRGDCIQVQFHVERTAALEQFAAKHGLEVLRSSTRKSDRLDVWVGSAQQGWINLHIHLAYYADGRPEPATDEQPDALEAAIEEAVAAVTAADDLAAESTSALADRLTPGGAL